MKRWKKFLVPGLGGLIFGAAAVLVRKQFQKPYPDFVTIPEEWEAFDLVFAGPPEVRYHCRRTAFKVWSLLGGSLDSASGQNRIYHVEEDGEEVRSEPYYATLHGVEPKGHRTRAGRLALGCGVEFRECRVGGAVNGVETGRRVRARGILTKIPRESVSYSATTAVP